MEQFRRTKAKRGVVPASLQAVAQIPSRIPQTLRSIIPFGETVGAFKPSPEYISPYELGAGVTRAKLVARGFDPEGAAVRWVGRAAGLALDIPTDILAWAGAPGLSQAQRATRVGRAIGVLEWAPRALARRVTGPAAAALRRIPGLAVLGKPIATKALVLAPFRVTGTAIEKMGGFRGPLGATARGMKSLGGWFKKNFTFLTRGGQVELGVLREGNAWARTFELGVSALDAPSYRRLNAFAQGPKAAGRLGRFVRNMGVARTTAAIREVSRRFGKKLPEVMASVVEARRLAPAVRGLNLTDDGARLMLEWAGELKITSERLLHGLQKVEIMRRKIDPTTTRELLDALTGTRKPLTGSEFQRAVALGIGRPGRELAGVVQNFPVALRGERIAFMPHIYDATAREFMGKNELWGRWASNLRERLMDGSPNLSGEQITNMLSDTLGEIKKRRAVGGEWSRLAVSKHMSAAELNHAAWAAGLPRDMQLVNLHPGLAFGIKGLKRVRRVGAVEVVAGVARLADEVPALKTVNTQFAEFLTDLRVASNSRPWRAGIMQGTGPLEGLYIMQDARRGWKIIDQDLAETAANYLELLSGQANAGRAMEAAANAWDIFQGTMKSFALNYSFGYHFRNWIDDVARMIVGEGPATVADGFNMAVQLQRGGNRAIRFADGSQIFDLARLDGELAKAGKIGGFFRSESGLALGSFKQSAKWNVLKRGSQAVGEWSENFRAEALMMGMLQKHSNLPFKEAVKRAGQSVRDILFAYGEITRFEKAIPARAIFFYRFMRKNIPFQIKALLEHPFRQLLAVRLPSMAFGAPERPEDVYMPEWIRARGGFPIEREGAFVRYSAGLGLSQFDVLAKLDPRSATREFLGALSPAIRIPLELISGKQFFIDMNIKDRNRIYNKQTADVLGLLDPIFEKLTGRRIVHKFKRGKREYWVVPGHVLWGLSQIRPLNDIKKILAMVAPSGEREGNVGKAILWAISGQKSYNIDIEASKRRAELAEINEMIRMLETSGIMRQLTISYRVKGLDGLTPYEDEMLKLARGRMRTFKRRGRRR